MMHSRRRGIRVIPKTVASAVTDTVKLDVVEDIGLVESTGRTEVTSWFQDVVAGEQIFGRTEGLDKSAEERSTAESVHGLVQIWYPTRVA